MTTRSWKAAIGAAAALFLAAPARAQLGFCFGPTIQRSVPNPVFDGVIDRDNGWLNSFVYRGGNGGQDAAILLQGNSFTDGGHQWLALGVTASNDTQWDAGDSVVVLYRSGATFGQIVVSPLQNDVAPSAPAVNGRPGTSRFLTSATGAPGSWVDQGNAPTWVTWGAVGTASGGACTAAQPGTSCKWTVELGIDTTAGGIAAFDKLYVDVVEIFDRNGPKSFQSSWPPGHPLLDVTDTTLTPAVADWGAASTSPNACKGVSFGYADISASPVDVNGNLKVGLTSTFTVKLHNSGANANGVVAHFGHAPFGICGLVETCFTEFGSSNTPTSCPSGAPPCCAGTAACIPPDPTNAGTALQAQWTPISADEGHQCVRVKLEATQGNTTFVNMGDFHNMWVDHASTVNAKATIDMKNVPAPEGGGNQRVRLYAHRQSQYAYADGALPDVPAATFTAQIITHYRGYRYTGRFVTVSGVRSEVWDPVGAYGYTIQHPMDQAFRTAFEGRHADVFARACRVLDMSQTDCLARLTARMGNDRRAVLLVNGLLDAIEEKPPVTDWTFEQGGVNQVNHSPDQGEIEVPLNGVVTVPTRIGYVPGGGGTCNSCFCGCMQTRSAPTAALISALLLAVVGVFAHRRKG